MNKPIHVYTHEFIIVYLLHGIFLSISTYLTYTARGSLKRKSSILSRQSNQNRVWDLFQSLPWGCDTTDLIPDMPRHHSVRSLGLKSPLQQPFPDTLIYGDKCVLNLHNTFQLPSQETTLKERVKGLVTVSIFLCESIHSS